MNGTDTEALVDELIEERGLECTPAHFRAKTAIKKLALLYPDTDEGDLWLAVLGMAVVDASTWQLGTFNTYFAADAYNYLSGDSIHACEVAGVDSGYAQRIISNTLEVDLRLNDE